jgi:hypothetical protein
MAEWRRGGRAGIWEGNQPPAESELWAAACDWRAKQPTWSQWMKLFFFVLNLWLAWLSSLYFFLQIYKSC